MTELVIRVVSLRDSGRRDAVANRLALLQRHWSFFDAIDRTGPPGLRYDPAIARRRFGRELGVAELGIFASHHALWREAAESPDTAVWLIVEDDVAFAPAFPALVDALLLHMQQQQIAFLRLSATTHGATAFEAHVASLDIVRHLGECWGTLGYLLTPHGARRLLAAIRRVERPIDNELDRYWVHGLPNRVVHPFMVRHEDTVSTAAADRSLMERDRRAGRQWRRWLFYSGKATMAWHGALTRIGLALRKLA